MYTPRYTISNNLLKYIGRIEACREVILNAPLVPSWEAHFREDAVVRSIHHGTHLEGNEITKEQAERLVHLEVEKNEDAGQIAQDAGIYAKHRDVQEVINYRSVLEWIDQHAIDEEKKKLFTLENLKKIHAIAMDKLMDIDSAHQLRTQQVVVRSVESGEIVFRPPVSLDIPFLLEEFLSWLNSKDAQDIHPVIRAGIVHYELVRIHPFVDGNGRTS